MNLAGKDYFTVPEAAEYAGVSYSHWRDKVQKEFPPLQPLQSRVARPRAEMNCCDG